MKKFWKKSSSLLLAVVSAAIFTVSPSGFANAAYVNQRRVDITSPESAFSGGAGVQGTYALDSQIALDKGGNIWIWGFYNYCTIWNAGQGGANSPTAKYGASYTDNTASGVAPIARDCGGVGGLNNQPAIIKGLNGIVSVAGSAYAIMAVDSKGNLYGWGDNSQYGFPYPASASLKASGGLYDPQSGGGVYGIYKDGTLPPEALPNKVNQANPNESPDTWKPIDGPDSVQPPASGPRYYADGFDKSKVISVSSNEYGFGWLKEDGTVWTVGYNNFGARGVGKQNGTGMGTGPNSRQWNSLNNLSGAPYNNNGGATLVPTKVAFPDGVKIKYLSNSYEGFHAIDTDNNVWYWGRVFTGNSGLTTEEIAANSSLDNSKPCYKVSGPEGWDEAYCYSPVYVPSITKVAKENGITKFAEGYQYGALLDEHKKLWVWGSGDYRSGMPNATGNIVRQWTPIPAVFTATTTRGDTITADNVVDVNGVMHGGSFVTGDGYVYAWGDAYWGGAFSKELSPTAPAKPVNYGANNNYPGVVWDPTLDPQHRKAVKVGGNKDAGNFNLEDGSIYSWGENGAGVALGGRGYGLTVCAEGLPNCVSPKVDTAGNRVQGGNDVWPATFVPGIQNVGRYETVVKNAYPFQDTPVKNGQVMEYTVKFVNDRTSYQNPAVRVEDVWGGSASLVPGSFRAKYTMFQSHAVDADVDSQWDVTSKFNLTNTGYNSTDATMQLLPQSTLVITYKVTVSGTSGSVGGTAKISDAVSGTEIDSDGTTNNIVS